MVASAETETRTPESTQIAASDHEAIVRVRSWLDETSYAASATKALTRGSPEDLAAASLAKAQPIVKLFLDGGTVDIDSSDAFADRKVIADLAQTGLLREEDGNLIPLVKITPFRGLLVVSDCEWVTDASATPNVVMGITGSTIWLANFAIRAKVESTLDLGTGTGVQAMLAAQHSTRVVATDLNPRALEFAKFNAVLNGVDNIEFLEGDMFDPIAGETFDLILCNPPFSVSPSSGCLYRDNAGDADEFSENIVRTASAYLNEGGFAQIMCNWVQSADEAWTQHVSSWLKDTGCNAWVARGKSRSPQDYAQTWLEGYDTDNKDLLVDTWMGYYRERGIVAIDAGLITMRREQRERNWIRLDSNLPRMCSDAGAYVARCFWLQDFLDSVPGYELLKETVYLSPSVQLTQTSEPTTRGWKLTKCELRMTRGIAYSVKLEPGLARIVSACGGRQSLGRILQAQAESRGEEIERAAARYNDALRRLVLLGFLWPARHGLDFDVEGAMINPFVQEYEDGTVAARFADEHGSDEGQAQSAR